MSSDANTTAEGTLELEAGADVDPDDAFSNPLAVKLGVGPRSEAYVALTPLVVLERPGPDEQGFGDVALGLRHRFWQSASAATAAAVAVATKLPTAKDGLGSGEVDFVTAGLRTGLNDDAQGTALLPGFTTNLGRVYRAR